MRRPILMILMLAATVLPGCGQAQVPIHHVTPPEAKPRQRDDAAVNVFSPLLPASAQIPSVSPDGKSVLFTLFSDGFEAGTTALRKVGIGGGVDTLIHAQAGEVAVSGPGRAWSPGDLITYTSDLTSTSEVWVTDLQGATTSLTAHSPQSIYGDPSFSPDGRWIVFTSDYLDPAKNLAADGRGDIGGIWKIRSDGTGLQQLTHGRSDGADDSQPQFSGDGMRIVFTRRTETDSIAQIYTMAADGSDVVQLTAANADAETPTWSPDGEWIAYASTGGNQDTANLWLMPSTGGDSIQLTHSSSNDDSAPSWSPDGQSIVFQTHLSQTTSSASIWRIAVPSLPAPTPLPTDLPGSAGTPGPSPA